MFLSKKWILTLLSITGILFMTLLIIQFGWIGKTVQIEQQRLANTIRNVSGMIRESFLSDSNFQKKYLSGFTNITDFSIEGNPKNDLELNVKHKIDSMLKTQHVPLSSRISGRIGHRCYLMNFSQGDSHNEDIDNAQFKVCVCSQERASAFDIGINLMSFGKLHGMDPAGLVFPSVILIVMLIGLFCYAVFIINRQKKLVEAKNDFINNLTHEFNTPLFSIGITSNLLLKSDEILQSQKLKTYVTLILSEKNRIQAQVDKILRLTAIESGGVIMDMEIIDLHVLIKEVIRSFEEIVLEKAGMITFYANAVDHSINGDRVHLLNAFSNLIDNSCKYSDRPPEIYVTTHNDRGHIIINVADNGIGMNKEETKMIFDKFYRVKQGDRHDTKGFGIGLSYVNKIIELHKGAIEVRTEPGKGSVFSIYLLTYNNQ